MLVRSMSSWLLARSLLRRLTHRGSGRHATVIAKSAAISAAIVAGLSMAALSAVRAADPVPATKPALSEKDRIDALIQAVQRAPGLQFVRNGSAHDAAAAADHLRLKWEKAGDRIKTAEQFIVGIASKSSMTGTPYQVRWPDGRSELAEQFLRAELAKIDARARAGKSG